MSRKLRNYVSVGILSLLSACATKQETDQEVQRVLGVPNRNLVSRKNTIREEILRYTQGPVTYDLSDVRVIKYPLRQRDAERVLDSLRGVFSGYSFTPDLQTNQLIIKLPNSPPESLEPRSKELLKFISELDVKSPQYDIRTYVMQVTASKLSAISTSLDVLVETGDVNLALNSLNLNKRSDERGIEHAVTGVLDSILPTLEVTALFDGLERAGYVQNLAHSQITLADLESGQIGGNRKVPIPKIYPTVPVPVVGYEHIGVDHLVKLTLRTRAEGFVDLDVEINQGSIVSTGREIPDIVSRNLRTKGRVKIGNTWILSTTLEDHESGVNERSPLGEIFGSTGRKQRERNYELIAIAIDRIDESAPETSIPSKELDRQLDRNGLEK